MVSEGNEFKPFIEMEEKKMNEDYIDYLIIIGFLFIVLGGLVWLGT